MKGTKPTKILVGGDRTTAKRFIGPANSQMEILKKQMSFQNRSQGVRRVWLYDNVYVECIKCFNYQECKIWVRPIVQEVSEEEVKEGIYFYVRISCEVEGREMDRIIIWRLRTEEKGSSPFSDVDYIDIGGYENGTTYWGIKEAGAVILDVDIAQEEVYSESGGVSVETTLEEAAQRALAQNYKTQICGSDFPPELLPDYFTGPICSPLELSSFCERQQHPVVDPEYYFNDPAPSRSYTGTGEWVDYYHMNRASIDEIKWTDCQYIDPDSCIHCYDPDYTFTENQWPKLDVNFDKYPPTNRSVMQHFYDPIGSIIPCGDYLGERTVYNPETGAYDKEVDVYLGTGLERVEGTTNWYWGTCVSPEDGGAWNKQGEHKDGYYYTTNGTFPCFFVTEYGITEQQHTKRICYADEDVQSDGTATFGGAPDSCYRATLTIRDVDYSIVTPLEQAEIAEFTSGQPGNPCDETINLHNWLNGGEGSFTIDWSADSDAWSGFPLSVLPPDVDPGGYNGYEGARIDKGYINSSFAPVLQSAKHGNKNAVSLTIFLDKTFQSTGAGDDYFWAPGSDFAVCNGVDPSLVDPVEGYQTGMMFYIMFPSFLSQDDGNGGTEYWDIHSEREDDPNEINHNRLLDLEDYVNAILNELKQDGIDNNDNDLLENRGYQIQTGFVYQKH